MELEEYRALVSKAEREYAADPAAQRRRVARFVALGYVYVWSLIGVIALALLAVLILMTKGHGVALLLKLAVGLGALFVIIVKALDVKFSIPTGIPVSRDDAPRFHQRIDEIRAALDAPAPDVVLLTADFNAAVTRLPDRGLGGAHVTYLVVGIPLLYALTPSQFDAVLAHEFGHLSGSHPKHGLRVWRMARIWRELVARVEESRKWGAMFFEDFFRWYIPRLNALGFAMARHDEREADADAARIAGAEAIGGALVALSIRGRYLQESFWPELWRRASEVPEPVPAWSILPQRIHESDLQPTRQDWIDTALQAAADENDTHPSLRERLLHLGLLSSDLDSQRQRTEQLLEPLHTSAAEHYLPSLARSHLETFEREWQEAAAKPWGERFAAAGKMRARLAELRQRDEERNDLTLQELWEMAATTADLMGEVAALPAARRVLSFRDDHAASHLMVGLALHELHEADFEQHLLRAMELDPDTTPPVAAVLIRVYEARSDETGKAELLKRYQAFVETTTAANAERSGVILGDKFQPPELSPDELAAIREAVIATAGLRDVLVGRKVTTYRAERPLFVMLLRRRWRRSVPPETVKKFYDSLRFPYDALVLPWTGGLAWLQDALQDSAAISVGTRAA